MIQEESGNPRLAVPTALMSLSYHPPERAVIVGAAISTLGRRNNVLSILAPPASGAGPGTRCTHGK